MALGFRILGFRVRDALGKVLCILLLGRGGSEVFGYFAVGATAKNGSCRSVRGLSGASLSGFTCLSTSVRF